MVYWWHTRLRVGRGSSILQFRPSNRQTNEKAANCEKQLTTPLLTLSNTFWEERTDLTTLPQTAPPVKAAIPVPLSVLYNRSLSDTAIVLYAIMLGGTE